MKKQYGSPFFRGLVLWTAGLVFAGALYASLTIPTTIDNSVQTIKRIIITPSGQGYGYGSTPIVTIDANSATPLVVRNSDGQTGMTLDTNGNIKSFDPTKTPNEINGAGSASIGGYGHNVEGDGAFSIGGHSNKVKGEAALSVGGWINNVDGDSSISIGSKTSSIKGSQSSIIGGYENTITGEQSFIVGGHQNKIFAMGSMIISSLQSVINGAKSVIIGGSNNLVEGDNSTAGGQNAQALHSNTWVWSDYDSDYEFNSGSNPMGTGIFASTKSNTFLIRAFNGVGINTNTPTDNASGKQALTVNGVVGAIKYCDISGANCILPSNVSPAEKDPTTRLLSDTYLPKWNASLKKFVNSLIVEIGSRINVRGNFQVAGEIKSPGFWSRGVGVVASPASTAMGNNSIAYGYGSTAMGSSTKANGNNSTAMGYLSIASGTRSLAMGESTQANGQNSTAMGKYSESVGPVSTAMGDGTKANGEASTAMGDATQANGDYSTAMGSNTIAVAESSTAMGKFNLGLANSLFEIGMGPNGGSRANALTVFADGKILAPVSIETPTLIVDKLVNRTVSNITVSGQLLPDPAAPAASQTIGSATSVWKALYAGGITALPDGKVGIGTNSIDGSVKFQVAGTIKSTTRVQSPEYCDANGSNCMLPRSDYVIGATLNNYVTTNTFNSTLNNYVTTNTFTVALDDYLKNDVLAVSINYLPKWNGSKLVTSLISEVNGFVGIGMVGSEKLSVNGNVLATAYYYSSDITLKKNIVSIHDALAKINKLNGYTFSWKSNDQKDMGVIAQEVEKVFPELVHADAKGIKSVEYGNLVAPIIEAIKELSHNLNTLFAKYIDQEARINSLETRLQVLEAHK